MMPLLRMLEAQGLSLHDAEAASRTDLANAVRRCQRCTDKDACAQWLRWQGKDGSRPPQCLNAGYWQQLRRPGADLDR